MTVKVRFFARFRELLGTDIPVEPENGANLLTLIRDIAQKKKEGYDAIFDEDGNFHEFVIVMRNGKPIRSASLNFFPDGRRGYRAADRCGKGARDRRCRGL